MSLRAFHNKRPILGSSVYIDESAVVIGDVTLGHDVSIWPTTVIRADVESITIGDSTNIQDGAVLHVSHAGKFSANGHPLNIGKSVTVGHRAVIHACTIGDFCLVGIGAIVMDDAGSRFISTTWQTLARRLLIYRITRPSHETLNRSRENLLRIFCSTLCALEK